MINISLHKSLMQPDLILGLPKTVLLLLFIFVVVLMYIANVWCFIFGVIAYIPCYLITKRDPDLFTIILDSLFEPDHLDA